MTAVSKTAAYTPQIKLSTVICYLELETVQSPFKLGAGISAFFHHPGTRQGLVISHMLT